MVECICILVGVWISNSIQKQNKMAANLSIKFGFYNDIDRTIHNQAHIDETGR